MFYGKYDISFKCGKSRKYDIYVERFHENVVFYAVHEKMTARLQKIIFHVSTYQYNKDVAKELALLMTNSHTLSNLVQILFPD